MATVAAAAVPAATRVQPAASSLIMRARELGSSVAQLVNGSRKEWAASQLIWPQKVVT